MPPRPCGQSPFSSFVDLSAADLSRHAVVKALDDLRRKGSPSMAGATRRYGCGAYAWAVKRGTVTENPFSTLPMAPVVKRERVLSDAEITAIWHATDGPGPFNAIVRLLLLTGQRRGEVAGMTWDELSSDLAAWTIPAGRAKNGKAHIVPLPELVREILRNTPRLGEHVFSTSKQPFGGWTAAKNTLDKRAGVADWRLHDLRRSCATGLQRLRVRLEVTEAVLNHAAGSRAGRVGVYQRHDFANEKRAALEAWGKHVLSIVEGRHDAAGNVVQPTRSASRNRPGKAMQRRRACRST
jgi:integrase